MTRKCRERDCGLSILRRATKMLTALAVLLLCGFGTLLASDPQVEVRVCQQVGAPGCDFVEAVSVATNRSWTYHYGGTIEINSDARAQTGCSVCRNSSSRTFEIAPLPCTFNSTTGELNDDCLYSIAVFLPNCPGGFLCEQSTCPTCDNFVACVDGICAGDGSACSVDRDCSCLDPWCPAVTSSVEITRWSLDGVNWTDLETPITFQPDPNCEQNTCEE